MKKTHTNIADQPSTLESVVSDKKVNKSHGQKKRLVAIIIIILLLLAIIGYLIYSWNQNSELQTKLDKTNKELLTKINQTGKDVTSLNKQVVALKAAYETAKAESTPNNPVAFEKVLSAFHLDTVFMSSVGNVVTYAKDQRGYNTAYIEVAVINKGTTDGYISSGSFKLKDSKDTTYEVFSEELRNRPELEGKQLLQSQSLAPGERTVGLIAFQVPADMNDFKLYFNNNIYNVTVN